MGIFVTVFSEPSHIFRVVKSLKDQQTSVFVQDKPKAKLYDISTQVFYSISNFLVIQNQNGFNNN